MAVSRLFQGVSTKQLFTLMIEHRLSRKFLVQMIDRRIYRDVVERNQDDRPLRVKQGKYAYLVALLNGFDRIASKGYVSRHVMQRWLDTFVDNVVMAEPGRGESHGGKPSFLVISPTGRCNLKCVGCYAASDGGDHASLSWEVFDRILSEKRALWGSHFNVISGGEPFMWRDGERDLLDMVEAHPTEFFMSYTNGTLIRERTAERMAELGNISLAVSMEGFEEKTDQRRGRGVFKKTLKTLELLRTHGIAFGVSVTPTARNWEEVTGDEFVDFAFEELGAMYIWSFQYMPIGRAPSLDMMVSPEDRIEMLRRMERFVYEQKRFYCDFWNSGIPTFGCLSAGRRGGYFYIDWNGDVMPCVFVPYAVDNINDVYARGDNLQTVYDSDFFKRMRDWQDDYGYAQPSAECGNWLCPCPMRDHFGDLREMVVRSGARPISTEAAFAIDDSEFLDRMREYDDRYRRLADPIWKERYADPPAELRERPREGDADRPPAMRA